jgi:hypothetical protein
MKFIKVTLLVIVSWTIALIVVIFGGYFFFGFQGAVTLDQYEWVAHFFHYFLALLAIILGSRYLKLKLLLGLIFLIALGLFDAIFITKF